MLKCISLWYKCLIYGYVSRSDSQMFISEGQVPHFLCTSASYFEQLVPPSDSQMFIYEGQVPHFLGTSASD